MINITQEDLMTIIEAVILVNQAPQVQSNLYKHPTQSGVFVTKQELINIITDTVYNPHFEYKRKVLIGIK